MTREEVMDTLQDVVEKLADLQDEDVSQYDVGAGALLVFAQKMVEDALERLIR